MTSQKEAGPSVHGVRMENVEIEDLGLVKSHGNSQAEARIEVSSASHTREGILVSNSRSKFTEDELQKIRHLYKIAITSTAACYSYSA